MNVPDFLKSDDGGYIHLVGHRIGLHHVLRLYVDGHSPEMIAAHYPTLPLALIHKVVAFYLENQPEADAYVAAHDREIERQITASPAAPTVQELRARVEARRRAETLPAEPPAGR